MEGEVITLLIIVYDDVEKYTRGYVEQLKEMDALEKAEIRSLSKDDFADIMKKLVERQKSFRRGVTKIEESLVDQASIIIVDFDLLESFDPFVTAESVAYLTRCFSKCGLIMSMNQRDRKGQKTTFDLSMEAELTSYADLDISSEQLDNPGLWMEKRVEFRPWHWPQLLDHVEALQCKVKEVAEHLDEPILSTLGIENIADTMPRSISQYLGRKSVKTSFRDFVEHSRYGLRPRDKNKFDEIVARIAASRISKWLERSLLPGQNILIDAPHLISRYPSLIKGETSKLDAWDRCTKFDNYNKLGINHEVIEEFRFKKNYWLSRPTWFWEPLSDSPSIKEIRTPWEKSETDFVFCEDTSSFYKREECKEFYAELDSQFRRRYVRNIKGIVYEPAVRFVRIDTGRFMSKKTS